MADQKRIKLYSLHATPKNVVMRELPVANASAATKIYLYTTHATPKNVVMRDPTSAPIPAGDTVNGALGATLGALTLSSAGQVTIDGDLVATLGTLTLSSAGQVIIDGDLAATLADLTLSSAGQLVIDGDLGVTLGPLTMGGVGNLPIAATEGTTLEALTLSATGTLGLSGTLGATLDTLTLASVGALEPLANTDRGDGASSSKEQRRKRRRAQSLRRNLAYLASIAEDTPVIERVVSKAVAREALAKAEAAGVIPDDAPSQWVPKAVSLPVADANDKALAVAAVIQELARRQAEDEEDIEMLLLAA